MSTLEPETVEPEENELHWNATRKAWIVKTATEYIEVPEKEHTQAMNEYLTSIGIERKTWSEYIHEVELAWQRQEIATRRLHRDIDFWKQYPGVEITPIPRKPPK